MRATRWTWLAVAIPLSGCAPDSPPFTEVADVKQLMTSVIDPAAEVYWDAVGWIIDANGTVEVAPSSSEEWEVVRNAAYVIAESGNLLMMEGRARDRGTWIAMSQAMTEVGKRALAAAEAQDESAVFDAGAEVYYACAGCHATYAVETLRPSDTPNR